MRMILLCDKRFSTPLKNCVSTRCIIRSKAFGCGLSFDRRRGIIGMHAMADNPATSVIRSYSVHKSQMLVYV